MSQLKTLKSATSLHQVAALLEYKPKALAFILYKQTGATKYHNFHVAKRRGGTRQISAPFSHLMLLQRRLSDLLQNSVAEINKANGWDDQLAHGFKRKRSIITNATNHRNRRHVLNLDLQEFFGTINFGRVRGFFLKDKNFALHPTVATVLAQIACHENALPQGSPCSPVISNLIGHLLDIHLSRLASRTGCRYSRYADDITFSTNKREFPTSVARAVADAEHKWEAGEELQRLVALAGFAINPRKTRMQYRDSRQEVTGLVVNRKVNIRSEYRHTVRAMAHRLFMTGTFQFIQTIDDERGVLTPTKTDGTLAQLHGMLGHIDRVDLHNKKLSSNTKGSTPKEKTSLNTKEHLYRRFLMFKEFYVAPAPVIVCEGKTDNVYILHAIRSLHARYPRMATLNPDGTIKVRVRIYKYTQTSTGRILRMNGGTGDLSNFIRDYSKEMGRFKAPGKSHPVILLVDNDGGATGKGKIYNVVEEVTRTRPTGAEPFVHIAGNLYLVATPLVPGADKSVIEDFFDGGIKATTVAGKTFKTGLGFDPNTHYGKHVFAQHVVKVHADKIDFAGFTAVLDNIDAVIDSHTKRYPVEAAP